MTSFSDRPTSRRGRGKPSNRLEVTPAMRRRLQAEGGSGRDEAHVWAREQMVARYPQEFSSAAEVLDRLSSDNSSRGKELVEEYRGLVGSWPGFIM